MFIFKIYYMCFWFLVANDLPTHETMYKDLTSIESHSEIMSFEEIVEYYEIQHFMCQL